MVDKIVALSQIGIKCWYANPLKHKFYADKLYKVVPDKLILPTRCMVLLAINEYTPLSTEEKKVLSGMLGVLKLRDNEIVQLSIIYKQHEQDIDWQQVSDYIADLQPETILQLGSTAVKLQLPMPLPYVVKTYHPGYLVANPKHKNQAFRDLLKLKKYLNYE